MNKIGVQSTGSIIQGDIEAGYRRIKEAGFDCVDFNFDEYLHCTMVERGEINAASIFCVNAFVVSGEK